MKPFISLQLHQRARLFIIPDLIWVSLLAAYIIAGVRLVPFHGDESTQIYMSRDYDYQFRQNDWSLVRYSPTPISPTEQQLRLLNGTLYKYLVGFGRHIAGIETTNEQWDWGADWNYNQSFGHAPSEDLLRIGRTTSALFLAAGVGVMFLLGRQLGGRPVAYFASLYYALHPVLLLNGRRAMQEGMMTFFALLVVLLTIWFLKRRSWRSAVLLGVAAGLALASKHTNIFTVAAVFGAIGLHLLYRFFQRQPHTAILKMALQVALIGLLTSGVFYALNPAWWGEPLERAQFVLNERRTLLNFQEGLFGGYSDFAEQIGGFARQTFLAQPQYFEVDNWAGFIGDQIAQYEASPWRGITLAGSTLGGVLLALLTLIGLWRLWQDRAIAGETRWIVGLWAVVVLAATALLTPLEWQRYYLPAYPMIGLLAASGVVWGIQTVTAQLQALRYHPI
ncbi:MAG: glycosyltransferase family 39 protein [bacterium]|nr:glycosyltransferase family 39 protein [bacterium]